MSFTFGPSNVVRRLGLLFAVLVAIGLLGACGDDDDDNSSGSTSGASSSEQTAGVGEAKEILDKYSELPTSIGDMTEIGEPIEGGKTIAFVNSGTPAVAANLAPTKEAAAVLGWKVIDVPAGTTAAENNAAWDRVVQLKPDFVQNTSGFPTASYAKQCRQMEAAGIAVFTNSVPRDQAFGSGDCVKGAINDDRQVAVLGEIVAAYVVADSDGEGDVVVLDVPQIPILTAFTKGLQAEMARLCPACGVDVIELPVSDLGTQEIPTKTVGFLRANPDTKYVAASYDDLLAGIPAALRGAGLDDIKLMGEAPQPGNAVAIANGEQAASVMFDQIQASWKAIDMMARFSVDGDLAATQESPMPWFLLTSDNVDVWPGTAEEFPWPTVADYQEQYKALWGVE